MIGRRYVTKPEPVDAVRYDSVNGHQKLHFEKLHGGSFYVGIEGHLCLKTFSGNYAVRHGDWIIRRKDGTFDLCAHEEFQKLYELVELNLEQRIRVAKTLRMLADDLETHLIPTTGLINAIDTSRTFV